MARTRADFDHAYHADLPRWQELTSRLGLALSVCRMKPPWPPQDVLLELTNAPDVGASILPFPEIACDAGHPSLCRDAKAAIRRPSLQDGCRLARGFLHQRQARGEVAQERRFVGEM